MSTEEKAYGGKNFPTIQYWNELPGKVGRSPSAEVVGKRLSNSISQKVAERMLLQGREIELPLVKLSPLILVVTLTFAPYSLSLWVCNRICLFCQIFSKCWRDKILKKGGLVLWNIYWLRMKGPVHEVAAPNDTGLSNPVSFDCLCILKQAIWCLWASCSLFIEWRSWSMKPFQFLY